MSEDERARAEAHAIEQSIARLRKSAAGATGGSGTVLYTEFLIADWKKLRVLIAALNAEGCPGRDAEEPDAVPIPGGEIRAAVGQQECVYCGGKEILSTLA